MAADRYVLLGLGRPRAEWFRAVAQWATTAALPAEFGKCMSAEELRARLDGDRPCSAVLLDAGVSTVDRDLIGDVREAGAVPIVVSDGRDRRQWIELGAVALLPSGFTRSELLDVLATHARLISAGEAATGQPAPEGAAVPDGLPGRLVAVTGPGGTGASTVAIGLAQGLVTHGAWGQTVVLADLCRRAEQAMLHDARDVFPGLQELVDAHRGGVPNAAEVRGLTFRVEQRGYFLLLGLRQPRYWASLRPRSFQAALESLTSVFRVVVCDVDGDVEGEEQGGSIDVEERNMLARAPVRRADVVAVVGDPGMKGLHSLTHLVRDLVDVGVQPSRVLPVLNGVPRTPRAKAELTKSLARLLRGAGVPDPPAPLLLPRVRVEQALMDGLPLPAPLPDLLAGGFGGLLRRLRDQDRALVLPPPPPPERVRPGTLGAAALEGER